MFLNAKDGVSVNGQLFGDKVTTVLNGFAVMGDVSGKSSTAV